MINLEQIISKKQEKNFLVKGVEIKITDQINRNISAKSVVSKVLNTIPKFLWLGLKSINIGNFKALKARNLQALYKDNKIFLSNEVSKEEELVDDIVHEIAHHVETKYEDFIYKDQSLKKEFLKKREILFQRLKNNNFDVDLNDFLKPRFDPAFDNFLAAKIGYPTIRAISSDIFHSPYAATSLREYFANGFEAYYMKENLPILKNSSPNLYRKIVKLGELEYEQDF